MGLWKQGSNDIYFSGIMEQMLNLYRVQENKGIFWEQRT